MWRRQTTRVVGRFLLAAVLSLTACASDPGRRAGSPVWPGAAPPNPAEMGWIPPGSQPYATVLAPPPQIAPPGTVPGAPAADAGGTFSGNFGQIIGPPPPVAGDALAAGPPPAVGLPLPPATPAPALRPSPPQPGVPGGGEFLPRGSGQSIFASPSPSQPPTPSTQQAPPPDGATQYGGADGDYPPPGFDEVAEDPASLYSGLAGSLMDEYNPNRNQLSDMQNILYAELPLGRVVIRMRPDLAPHHVARIKELTRAGYYDGAPFWRVIEGFMAQTGDPTGTGYGGSGVTLAAEISNAKHIRGTVSMARGDDPNSADSQFFILYDDAPWLDGKYTIWGEVLDGMEYVDALAKGDDEGGRVAHPDRLLQLSVAADAASN